MHSMLLSGNAIKIIPLNRVKTRPTHRHRPAINWFNCCTTEPIFSLHCLREFLINPQIYRSAPAATYVGGRNVRIIRFLIKGRKSKRVSFVSWKNTENSLGRRTLFSKCSSVPIRGFNLFNLLQIYSHRRINNYVGRGGRIRIRTSGWKQQEEMEIRIEHGDWEQQSHLQTTFFLPEQSRNRIWSKSMRLKKIPSGFLVCHC